MAYAEVKSIAVLFDCTKTPKNCNDEPLDTPDRGLYDFDPQMVFVPLYDHFPSKLPGLYFAVGTEEIYTLYAVSRQGVVVEIYKREAC